MRRSRIARASLCPAPPRRRPQRPAHSRPGPRDSVRASPHRSLRDQEIRHADPPRAPRRTGLKQRTFHRSAPWGKATRVTELPKFEAPPAGRHSGFIAYLDCCAEPFLRARASVRPSRRGPGGERTAPRPPDAWAPFDYGPKRRCRHGGTLTRLHCFDRLREVAPDRRTRSRPATRNAPQEIHCFQRIV